jgi:protein subunit release factor B
VTDVPAALRAQARRALSLPGEALLSECDEEFFVAGGPGGQHRNKTESGVRLVHRPTGVVVTATERRSQARNRAEALVRLRERLAALSHVPRRRVATRPGRGARERRLSDKRHQSERKSARRATD